MQGHAHRQELIHAGQHILHRLIHAAGMKIGTDGIRKETLLHRGYCLRVSKAYSSITHVKNDPALPGFIYKRLYLIGLEIYNIFPAPQLPKTMSEDIARTQVFQKQLLNRHRRVTPTEINHSRDAACQCTGLYRTVGRRPVVPIIMGQLNAYYNVLISSGHQGRHLRVHVIDVLLVPAAHALTDNIQERQYPRL